MLRNTRAESPKEHLGLQGVHISIMTRNPGAIFMMYFILLCMICPHCKTGDAGETLSSIGTVFTTRRLRPDENIDTIRIGPANVGLSVNLSEVARKVIDQRDRSKQRLAGPTRLQVSKSTSSHLTTPPHHHVWSSTHLLGVRSILQTSRTPSPPSAQA